MRPVFVQDAPAGICDGWDESTSGKDRFPAAYKIVYMEHGGRSWTRGNSRRLSGTEYGT